MAKKRSRRAASPAQLAARARFTAMVKSGAFTPGKKKAKKSKAKAAKKVKAQAKRAAKKAKRASKKAARRNPIHKKKHHAKKHPARKRKYRRNDAAAAAAAAGQIKSGAKKAAAVKKAEAAAKRAAKKAEAAAKKAEKVAESAAETAAFQKEARQGERAAKRAARTPAQRRAAKRLSDLRKKNAKKLSAVKSSLKKTRAALKAIPKGKRPAKGEKVGKRSARRRILKTKKAALNLTRSALIGTMSAADQKVLKAAGLMRANPGFGEIFASFKALAPQIGVHAVALAGVAVAGQKLGDMIAQKAPASMPGRAFIAQHAVTIGSVAAAIGAYELAKHASPKTRPFAGAVLMGGLAAAFVHAAARASWGQKIGLPFAAAPALPAPAAAAAASAAALKGYIDVDGQALAVDGMGEYMALSGNTLTGSSLGEYMALSGNTLTGSSLGEYMALSGSTLTGSTLGEIGQMSEGRQGARALNSPGDPTVEDILDEGDEDEGSLSGSIFDD